MTTLRDWLLALFILAGLSLSVGCGTEPEPQPVRAAEPRPLDVPRPPVPAAVEAVVESCAVVLLDDGNVICNCQPK